MYLVLLACIGGFATPAFSQLASLDRERAQSILDGVASDIRKEYYDPKFHGIDWNAKVDASLRICRQGDILERCDDRDRRAYGFLE
jgi:hypothetical protein